MLLDQCSASAPNSPSPEPSPSGLLKRKRRQFVDDANCAEAEEDPIEESDGETSRASQVLSQHLHEGSPRRRARTQLLEESNPVKHRDLRHFMEESRRRAISRYAPATCATSSLGSKATPVSQINGTGLAAAAEAEAIRRCRASAAATKPLATPCRARPHGSPWQAPSASSDGKGGLSDSASLSVKDLKARLAASGLDFSACVEKVELQALWSRYEELRSMPLEPLQALCAAAGGCASSADACARFLMTRRKAVSSASAPATASPALGIPLVSREPDPVTAPLSAEAQQRDREANQEVGRILPLRRDSFQTLAAWGFAVLALPASTAKDHGAVQKNYRTLMRRLHPDKVPQTAKVVKAVEMIREAKSSCERSLLRLEPPGPPRGLRSFALDAKTIGRRRFQLQWAPPFSNMETAPVRRYIVAALDPAYGKPLTITVLEPDYNPDLQRFISVAELGCYVLAEEELQKMPSLWQQKRATLQVAAANEAGQSAWATIEVPLSAAHGLTASTTASSCNSSRSSGDSPGFYSCSESSLRGDYEDNSDFEMELRRRCGPELRAWLSRRLKAQLVSWLRTMRTATTGTKEELIARIIRMVEGDE